VGGGWGVERRVHCAHDSKERISRKTKKTLPGGDLLENLHKGINEGLRPMGVGISSFLWNDMEESW